MPEAIRAAVSRFKDVSPKDARTHAAVTQLKWAEWWGLSITTVRRAEDENNWERYPVACQRLIVMWMALFGPEPEEAFRAVGRWALGNDIRNATDAVFVRAVSGVDPVEAMTRAVLERDRRETA